MLPEPLRPEDIATQRRIVTSRAAENLFWMGRYAERAEFSVRLARAVISRLGDDDNDAPAVLEAMARLAAQHGLVPDGVPSPARSAQGAIVFERALQAELTVEHGVAGVEFDLGALTRSASQIRERLSSEHWRLLVDTSRGFREDCARLKAEGAYSADEVLAMLSRLAVQLAAITGAQMDRMTRDDGWRLLAIGRHLERGGALARALHVMLDCDAFAHEQGYELALDLFDSTITYRAMYQSRMEVPPLIDLLVLNIYNPRALAGVVRRMGREMERLPPGAADELRPLVPELDKCNAARVPLVARDGHRYHVRRNRRALLHPRGRPPAAAQRIDETTPALAALAAPRGGRSVAWGGPARLRWPPSASSRSSTRRRRGTGRASPSRATSHTCFRGATAGRRSSTSTC